MSPFLFANRSLSQYYPMVTFASQTGFVRYWNRILNLFRFELFPFILYTRWKPSMGLFVFKPKPSYCIALSCHTRCRRNFYPCFCTRGKCPGYSFQQYLTICPLHRYYIRIFEQIKTWCYCKIWIFSLQFVFICNTCICFNVKIYICIKPVKSNI